MLSKRWRCTNDWSAEKQDKDLLGVLSGKSGLNQSLTPSSHYSHIGAVVVALLMLLWLPPWGKMAFAGGGMDKITGFMCSVQGLMSLAGFQLLLWSTAQLLCLWDGISAIQGGAALGDSSAMAWGSFRAEGHGQGVQGEAGNPWISLNALWVWSWVRTVLETLGNILSESCQVFCPEEKTVLTSTRKVHY